ncbi:hypothetical protein ACEQ8H_003533 [Pleosporales sp. CAS-2024a]
MSDARAIDRVLAAQQTLHPSRLPVSASITHFPSSVPSQNTPALLPVISPNPTRAPVPSAPDLPQPSVLTQMPLLLPLQAQYSLTHTKPTSQPAVAEQGTARGFFASASSHLNLAESKQTPAPSDSLPHVQVEVPLLLQRRRNWQFESQAGAVQTPSWQPPLQSATPVPVQMGVFVGDSELVVKDVTVMRVDDWLALALRLELEFEMPDEDAVELALEVVVALIAIELPVVNELTPELALELTGNVAEKFELTVDDDMFTLLLSDEPGALLLNELVVKGSVTVAVLLAELLLDGMPDDPLVATGGPLELLEDVGHGGPVKQEELQQWSL